MKLFGQITSCLAVLWLAACTSSVEKPEQPNAPKPLGTPSFVVRDTITIDYTKGIFNLLSMKDGNKLCDDPISKEILVLNEDWQVAHSFSRQRDDDKGFGETLAGAGFYGDSAVVVASRKGFFFYDYNGELLKKMPHAKSVKGLTTNLSNRVYPLFAQGDSLLALSLYPGTDKIVRDEEFIDELALFTLANVASGEYKFIGSVPQNSIYRSGKWFRNSNLYVWADHASDKLYVIHQLSPEILPFDVSKSFEPLPPIQLNDDFFQQPIGFEFHKKTLSIEENIRSLVGNSQYLSLLGHRDTLYAVFTKGIEIDEPFTSIEAFNESYSQASENYLQIVINGKQVSDDIPIPNDLGHLVWANSLNELYLMTLDANENIIVYVASLQP